ncbi:MAG: biotin/lipoyl-binding protein [Pirellulaceae bacterium]|nr:biotin/lipoyl-binding protein [Pirellulaceae bacterium]
MNDARETYGATASPDAGTLGDRVRSLRLPPPNQAARSAAGRIPWLLCALLVGTNLVLGYFVWQRPADSSQRAGTPNSSPGAPPSTTATTGSPGSPNSSSSPRAAASVTELGQLVLESKGYIIPTHQILVSPEVSGRVIELFVEEGKKVAQGDILARIEPIEYDADQRRARAILELARQQLLELERGNRPEEIEQAQKELEEAQAELAQMASDLKRAEMLRRTNGLSEQEYEEIESRHLATSRRVERLTSKWELLKKGPRQEQIEIARADV